MHQRQLEDVHRDTYLALSLSLAAAGARSILRGMAGIPGIPKKSPRSSMPGIPLQSVRQCFRIKFAYDRHVQSHVLVVNFGLHSFQLGL